MLKVVCLMVLLVGAWCQELQRVRNISFNENLKVMLKSWTVFKKKKKFIRNAESWLFPHIHVSMSILFCAVNSFFRRNSSSVLVGIHLSQCMFCIANCDMFVHLNFEQVRLDEAMSLDNEDYFKTKSRLVRSSRQRPKVYCFYPRF